MNPEALSPVALTSVSVRSLKPLVAALFFAVPNLLAAAWPESYLVRGDKIDGDTISGKVLVVAKGGSGMRIEAQRVVVTSGAIHCEGEVALHVAGETIRMLDLSFSTDGAPVYILNPNGIVLAGRTAMPTGRGAAQPATEFRLEMPRTDARLPGMAR